MISSTVNKLKISINVKIYSFKDFVFGEISSSLIRNLVVEVTKVEEVLALGDGYAMYVLRAISPISKMLRSMCSSSQYLAVLETLSYTVRETFERNEGLFHSTDYENFSVVVETNLTGRV